MLLVSPTKSRDIFSRLYQDYLFSSALFNLILLNQSQQEQKMNESMEWRQIVKHNGLSFVIWLIGNWKRFIKNSLNDKELQTAMILIKNQKRPDQNVCVWQKDIMTQFSRKPHKPTDGQFQNIIPCLFHTDSIIIF